MRIDGNDFRFPNNTTHVEIMVERVGTIGSKDPIIKMVMGPDQGWDWRPVNDAFRLAGDEFVIRVKAIPVLAVESAGP